MNRHDFRIFFSFIIICSSLGGFFCYQAHIKARSNKSSSHEQMMFQTLLKAQWEEVFFDSGEENWQQKWFLDGQKANIQHSSLGMDFYAGPLAGNDAHHAVLWTQQVFEGNIKIEYEYTRLDQAIEYVNILYLQATGSKESPFLEDISDWKDLRRNPSMKLYFNHMNLYHISYAAFEVDNAHKDSDYIRARRYIPLRKQGLKGTKLQPEYTSTKLFKPGVPHKITVIKQDHQIFMQIDNGHKQLLCHWENNELPPIHKGRIGLRHMYTRAARYKNFRISRR